MRLASVCPGSDVLLHDTEYTIVSFDETKKEFDLQSKQGTKKTFEFGVLMQHYLDGNLRSPLEESQRARKIRKEREASARAIKSDLISATTSAQSLVVQQRLKLLRWISDNGVSLNDVRKFKTEMLRYASERKDGDAPAVSMSTVKRWAARLATNHFDYSAIAPRTSLRGGAGIPRLHPTVEKLLEQAIDNHYLTKGGDSKHTTHRILEGMVLEANKFRSETDQLSCPSYPTLRRRIKERNQFHVHASRFGKAAAKAKFRSGFRKPTNSGTFMEEFQMDHTVVDLILVHPGTLLPLGRPRLTVCIECKTRMVVGYSIGLDGNSTICVLETLLAAMLPKPVERLIEVGAKSPWPAMGMPIKVTVDNGLEFHSVGFQTACSELGLIGGWCGARMPWQKGNVERVIGEFIRKGVGYLPGATVPPHLRTVLGLDKDPKNDPSKWAMVSLEDLDRVLLKWIVDEYHNSPHEGLGGMTPLQAWETLASIDRIQLPDDVARLALMCTLPDTRDITAMGIRICNVRHFNSFELQSARQQFGAKGTTVNVRYTPRKLDRIWFEHPSTKEWHVVLNSDPETRDLSEREIQVVKEYQNLAQNKQAKMTFAEARAQAARSAREASVSRKASVRRLANAVAGLQLPPKKKPDFPKPDKSAPTSAPNLFPAPSAVLPKPHPISAGAPAKTAAPVIQLDAARTATSATRSVQPLQLKRI